MNVSMDKADRLKYNYKASIKNRIIILRNQIKIIEDKETHTFDDIEQVRLLKTRLDEVETLRSLMHL